MLQHRVVIFTDTRKRIQGCTQVHTTKSGALVFSDLRVADQVMAAVNDADINHNSSNTFARRSTRAWVGRTAVDFETNEPRDVVRALMSIIDSIEDELTAPVSIAVE